MGYKEPMEHDETFLRQAIDLSRRNMAGQAGGPFGAVVVKDGKVVGQGWNRVTETHDPTAHAEVSAIRDACKNLGTHVLDGAVLYTSCEPCPMCLASAYWARVARIVWGNTRQDAAAIGFDDEFLYREVALPPEKRSVPMRELLRDEARAVFTSWAARPDKVMY
jgi:tRNA(Arg) A34 adenosine deaminase TadA